MSYCYPSEEIILSVFALYFYSLMSEGGDFDSTNLANGVFNSFLIQPFYISLLNKWLQQTDPACSTYKAFDMLVILFSTALFCGIVTMSVDRFLSIYFHLRYQGCCWSDLNRGSKYVFSFAGIVGNSEYWYFF